MQSPQPREAIGAPAPIAPDERVLVLDVLRGFAVFGILVVNILFFSQPMEWAFLSPFRDPANRISAALIQVFFSGKFYSIFSMLFGLGFSIQFLRAERRGEAVGWRYARRLLVLFVIGVAHASLIWYGDILHAYAFLGFFLILFRNAKPGTILAIAVICLAIPVGLGAMGALVTSFVPPEQLQVTPEQTDEAFATTAALRNYADGTWRELTRQRVRDWLMLDLYSIFYLPNIFAMFLVGLWIGKREIHLRLDEWKGRLRIAVWIAGVIGLAANVAMVVLRQGANPLVPSWGQALSQLAYAIGVPSLAIAYASTIALLWSRPRPSRTLASLAPVGRMALTNYLAQSIVCTMIFYSYGLGLFGRFGSWIALPLAIVIFGLQIPLSAWWLSRFRFGPVEWLWRTLTYGKAQPMTWNPPQSF